VAAEGQPRDDTSPGEERERDEADQQAAHRERLAAPQGVGTVSRSVAPGGLDSRGVESGDAEAVESLEDLVDFVRRAPGTLVELVRTMLDAATVYE
jgi:hypothetical protein